MPSLSPAILALDFYLISSNKNALIITNTEICVYRAGKHLEERIISAKTAQSQC